MVLWSKSSTLDRKVEESNPAAANFSFEVDDLDARRKKEDGNENRRARERPLTRKRAPNRVVLCNIWFSGFLLIRLYGVIFGRLVFYLFGPLDPARSSIPQIKIVKIFLLTLITLTGSNNFSRIFYYYFTNLI